MLEDEGIYKKQEDEFIEKTFLPQAKKMFADHKMINGVVMAIASYWNDEADNQIHMALIPFSTKKFPGWESVLSGEKNKCLKEFNLDITKEYISNYSPSSFWDKYKLDYEGNDETIIELFMSHCNQNCDQEMDQSESFCPYLIAFRDNNSKDGFKIKYWKEFYMSEKYSLFKVKKLNKAQKKIVSDFTEKTFPIQSK